MTYYLGIGLLTVLIGQFTKGKYKNAAYFLIFSLLVLMYGLRGDFTSDYQNYLYLFNYYHNTDLASILKVESAQEIGFVLLTKFLSNYVSYQIYLVIIGVVIVGCFMYGFIKESSEPWIALILFLGFGSYFDSFNTTRQAMAVAILFAGSRYLYSRELKKYLLFVFIAATMHLTAILMIPMFFLLNLEINKGYIIKVAIFSLTALIGLKPIADVVKRIFPRFSTYSFGRYGMTGGTMGYFLPSIVMFGIILILYYTGSSGFFDTNNPKIRIQMNALGYAFIIAILTTQAFLLHRLTGFLLPHSFLLISNMLSKSKMRTNKTIIAIGVTLLCLMYIFISLSGTGYDPYRFYWQF